MVKMLHKKAQKTMMLKLTFMQNLAAPDLTNSSLETVIFDPKEILGILHLRLTGYYMIKQGILQQSLSKYYSFQSAGILCEQFSKFINTLKKEKEETRDKYSWLDQVDKRRSMLDKEILERYVDLENLVCQI